MPDRTDIRLLCTLERSSWNIDAGVLRFDARFVYIHPDDGRLLNPRYDDWGDPHGVNHLDSLAITAQANLEPTHTDGFYGMKVEYAEPFRVDRKYAELMVKTLKRLDARLDAMNNELGYVENLHTYVGRVASILKVTSIGWRTKLGSMYENSEYRWGDVNSLRYWLEDNLREARGVKS